MVLRESLPPPPGVFWRRSTKEAVLCVFKTHLLPSFGEKRLCDLTRFDLQALINALTRKYSTSVMQKALRGSRRVWKKLWKDFLVKNPARKLEMPITTCALRPGELFALRWRSIVPGRLSIEEADYRGHIGSPKTKGSRAYVAIPKSLEIELELWRHQCGDPDEDEFLFR